MIPCVLDGPRCYQDTYCIISIDVSYEAHICYYLNRSRTDQRTIKKKDREDLVCICAYMLSKRGKTDEVFNIDQWQFQINTSNCWFAWPMIWYSNNVIKRQLSLEDQRDIEKRAYENFVMPKAWLTLTGWLIRISQLTGSKFERFAFNSPQMNDWLNRWYVVNVNITINDEFIRQWWNSDIIGDCNGQWSTWGHVCSIFKKDGEYYLLNSRQWHKFKKLKSLNIQWLFKSWETCGVIY